MDAHAADLRHYLQQSREALVRAMEGLSEHDVRRPVLPSGTNLLGLVKHLVGVEAAYLGDCVGRPAPFRLAWVEDGSIWESADMWATAEESRDEIVQLYRAAWAHSDAAIAELPLDHPATVSWWPEGATTFGHLLVRVVAETAQHAGHADTVRETIDGRGGQDHDDIGDAAWWHSYVSRIQKAADTFAARPEFSAGAAYVDGAFCAVAEATISVLDLGMTRSDCTYDVAHVRQGRFYRLDDHLDRFFAGMEALRLDPGHERDEVERVLHECVARAGLQDAYVSMTCTRGRLPAGSRDLRTARHTFYCFAVPFVWINTPEQQATGGSLWISDLRRIPPESVDPQVKNYHWLDLDRALLDAYDHGADLVVLRDASGAITEGPGFNVFAHTNGAWRTPSHGVLAGITRRSVIELVEEHGARVEQGPVSAEQLRAASEVLVTSTAGGVMPVTSIDGRPVGSGMPGPLTEDLRQRYWARHSDPEWSTPVRYAEGPADGRSGSGPVAQC